MVMVYLVGMYINIPGDINTRAENYLKIHLLTSTVVRLRLTSNSRIKIFWIQMVQLVS